VVEFNRAIKPQLGYSDLKTRSSPTSVRPKRLSSSISHLVARIPVSDGHHGEVVSLATYSRRSKTN
jgi:hypothetical protein